MGPRGVATSPVVVRTSAGEGGKAGLPFKAPSPSPSGRAS